MGLEKFSWREVRARPLRVFLTFLSIAIGVGAVVAVLSATTTTRIAQRDILKTVSGRADIEVVAGGTGFPYSALKDLESVPNIQFAVPGLNRFAVIFTEKDLKARAQVLGVDPRIDQQVRDYELVEGQLPTSLRQLILDKSFADSLDIKVGETVKLLTKSGMLDFSVVGLVRPSSGSAVVLSSAVYLVLPAAQRAFQAGNNIDQIQIVIEDQAQLEETIDQVTQAMPAGVSVRAVRTRSAMAQETLFAPQNGLRMAVAFAIIIAVFIIYNTFQMAVGERRKQLGILRAIGATPNQIQWMILREALWISLLGSVAGCIAGIYGAKLLNQATETILQVSLPGISLQVWPFALAVAVGVSVSLLGAVIPARSAAAVNPMEAIRAIPNISQRIKQGPAVPLSFAMWILGLVLIWMSTRGVALGLDVAGVVLILLAFVLLVPRFLEPACQQLTDLLEPWIGVSARLAAKQLLRHVSRTSMTVGVLFVAIATSLGMAGNILDNVQNVQNWYHQTIVGDFFVRASLPDFATGATADLPPEIEMKVRALDGIDQVHPMRLVSVESGDDSLLLVARDFDGQVIEFFDLVKGDSQKAFEQLAAGQVVIGSVLALRRKLDVGDSIEIKTGSGVAKMPIAGVNNDYLGGGLTVYMDRTVAAEKLDIEGIDALIIRASSDRLRQVESDLRLICNENGLILQSYADLISLIDSMVNSVVGSLWMLLALGCGIAAMGLVNTLTMNILEQTREIGMLRVVAMTRQQVRSMVFSQALVLGILGILPGVLVGFFVQFAIGLSSQVVLGHEVAFHFRPGLFSGAAAIGLLLVLVASLIPAERAARLKMASALQCE
jgi:putative ABC transport system permease protein